MKILKIIFSLLLFESFIFPTYSQILNIDREIGSDTVNKKWEGVSGISVSTDKQKRNLIDINSNFELNYNTKSHRVLFGILRNDAVFNGKNTIQNEGMFHVRFRDKDYRKYSIEEYIQYQWNGAWGMDYRYLGGLNFRVRWIEKKNFDFYTGIGLFKEWEKWNWNGVKENLLPTILDNKLRSVYRLNNYVKLSAKLNKSIDFTTTSFLQFPLEGAFWKPRWYLEANFYVNTSKHTNFVFHWDHIVDDNKLVPIESFYYGFSTGLQINY